MRQLYGAKQKRDSWKEPSSKENHLYNSPKSSKYQNSNYYKRPILSQKNLYRIKRSLDIHTDKYKELHEYEQMKQRIRWEQERC